MSIQQLLKPFFQAFLNLPLIDSSPSEAATVAMSTAYLLRLLGAMPGAEQKVAATFTDASEMHISHILQCFLE